MVKEFDLSSNENTHSGINTHRFHFFLSKFSKKKKKETFNKDNLDNEIKCRRDLFFGATQCFGEWG